MEESKVWFDMMEDELGAPAETDMLFWGLLVVGERVTCNRGELEK